MAKEVETIILNQGDLGVKWTPGEPHIFVDIAGVMVDLTVYQLDATINNLQEMKKIIEEHDGTNN